MSARNRVRQCYAYRALRESGHTLSTGAVALTLLVALLAALVSGLRRWLS